MFSSAGFSALREQILDHLLEIEAPMAALFPFIRKGTVPRRADDPVYRGRLAYTQALRRFVYNPAVFNEVLWDPELKERFFRVFGYRGNLDFTLYPDAWIRDLALPGFEIGKRVYLADGIVLGTNQVSPDQTKLRVGPIAIGDDTIFDQDCKVGLGTTIGRDCKFGISSNVGLMSTVGDGVVVSALAAIGHFVTVGRDVVFGEQCHIGNKSRVEDGARIPARTYVPAKSLVRKDGAIVPLYPSEVPERLEADPERAPLAPTSARWSAASVSVRSSRSAV